jgi:hypothetical protein
MKVIDENGTTIYFQIPDESVVTITADEITIRMYGELVMWFVRAKSQLVIRAQTLRIPDYEWFPFVKEIAKHFGDTYA